MPYAIKVNSLVKHYSTFSLNDISLTIPYGSIMGLAGANGAGKTTLLNSILRITDIYSGDIYILDKSIDILAQSEFKEVGVVLERNCYPEMLTPIQLNKIMIGIFTNWDQTQFFSMLEVFNLPQKKKIGKFSSGMKKLLSFAVAISHNAKVLVIDEVTSGLDPMARELVLAKIKEFSKSENRSVLLTSHNLNDFLDICDYISFLQNGLLIFSESKEELLHKYIYAEVSDEMYHAFNKNNILAAKQSSNGWLVLMLSLYRNFDEYSKISFLSASLEMIMHLYGR